MVVYSTSDASLYRPFAQMCFTHVTRIAHYGCFATACRRLLTIRILSGMYGMHLVRMCVAEAHAEIAPMSLVANKIF